MEKIKINFFCEQQRFGYSGGRYHAIMLAVYLSTVEGVDVNFHTNSPKTQIYDECFSFIPYSTIIFKTFDEKPTEADFSFVIAGGSRDRHLQMLHLAKSTSKKTFFFSFETPNWFNHVCPYKRPESKWSGWAECYRSCDYLATISQECANWAMKYYGSTKPTIVFDGPINSFVANKISAKQNRSISFFTRIGPTSLHKGLDKLELLNSNLLENYVVNVNFGNSDLSRTIKDDLVQKFRKNKIDIFFTSSISEHQKFRILNSSDILFFPTQFEGLGLPPLEGLYCGNKILCSDLKVLGERWSDNYFFFNVQDEESFERALRNVIEKQFKTEEWEKAKDYLEAYKFAKRKIQEILCLE